MASANSPQDGAKASQGQIGRPSSGTCTRDCSRKPDCSSDGVCEATAGSFAGTNVLSAPARYTVHTLTSDHNVFLLALYMAVVGGAQCYL